MDLTEPSTSIAETRMFVSGVRFRNRPIEPLAVGAGFGVLLTALALAGCGGSGNDASAEAKAPPVSMEAVSSADFQQEYSRLEGRIQQMRAETLDKYDFEGFTAALRDSGESAPLLLRSAGQLGAMMDWLETRVGTYSRGEPLIAKTLDEKANPLIQIFSAAGRVSVIDRGAMRLLMNWSSLPPSTVAAIIVSALQEAPTRPREAVLGAQAFARLFDQPAMLKIVTPMLDEGAAPTEDSD